MGKMGILRIEADSYEGIRKGIEYLDTDKIDINILDITQGKQTTYGSWTTHFEFDYKEEFENEIGYDIHFKAIFDKTGKLTRILCPSDDAWQESMRYLESGERVMPIEAEVIPPMIMAEHLDRDIDAVYGPSLIDFNYVKMTQVILNITGSVDAARKVLLEIHKQLGV